MKSRPVLIIFSILAGLQILTAGAALGDVVGKDVVGLLVLAIAAVQTGMTFYVQNQVTPMNDVSAYVDQEGQTVAGPASPVTVIEGERVVVTPTHL
jgi:hypothetical protein